MPREQSQRGRGAKRFKDLFSAYQHVYSLNDLKWLGTGIYIGRYNYLVRPVVVSSDAKVSANLDAPSSSDRESTLDRLEFDRP